MKRRLMRLLLVLSYMPVTAGTIKSGVTGIGGGAFQECDRLKKVTIPEGVDGVLYDKDKTEPVCFPGEKHSHDCFCVGYCIEHKGEFENTSFIWDA